MRSLPTEPGRFFWDEWNREVDVTRRGNSLYVRVYSHWQPVKISPRIAGNFYKVNEDGKRSFEGTTRAGH